MMRVTVHTILAALEFPWKLNQQSKQEIADAKISVPIDIT